MLKLINLRTRPVYSAVLIRTMCSNNKSLSNFSPESHCLDSTKKYDFENYLCSLLIEGRARRSVFSVRSFNVEIARIPSLVRS
jgi:hypothetical protein